MADALAFDAACRMLEERTSLDRLEARGTVRLALRAAGLEARSVTAAQMGVVVDKVLPDELVNRGVSDAGEVCRGIRAELSTLGSEDAAESPEAVFARLGGSTAP